MYPPPSAAQPDDAPGPSPWRTIAFQFGLRGPAGPDAVRTALYGIVCRHEVLRSRLVENADGPAVVVGPPSPVTVTDHDLRALTPDRQRARAAVLARDTARHGFDLTSGAPLLRATLMRIRDDEAWLVVAVDHFAFDGYSVGVFTAELAAGVDAAVEGRADPNQEPDLQVGDIALFEQALMSRPPGSEVQAAQDRLRSELRAVAVPRFEPSALDESPAEDSLITRPVDGDRLTALRRLVSDCGVTEFAVFAAAVGIVVAELTDAPDVMIGAITAVRNRPGVERVIGPLMSMIPFPVRSSDSPSFRTLTTQVTDVANRALAQHEFNPMEILPPDSSGMPQMPTAMLSMMPVVPLTVTRGETRIEQLGEVDNGIGGAISPLLFMVAHSAAGMDVMLEYDTLLFDHERARSILDLLVRVLDHAAQDPDRPVVPGKVGGQPLHST